MFENDEAIADGTSLTVGDASRAWFRFDQFEPLAA
jgi:hypothetical protein